MAEGGQGHARVRNAQDFLVYMEALKPGTKEAILSLASPEVRGLMETAPRTGWITLEQDANFVDAIVAANGVAQASEFWFGYTARFVQTPLQRSMFDGAIRVFGLSVGTFVRMIPKIWSTAYRDAGELDAREAGQGYRNLHITNMHPEMCSRDGYFILLQAMFRGMYRLAGDESDDFEVTFDPGARELHANFMWT